MLAFYLSEALSRLRDNPKPRVIARFDVSLEGKTPGRNSLVWEVKAAGQLVQPVTRNVQASLVHSVVIYRETFQLALRNKKNAVQVKIQFKIVKEK